MKIDVSPEEFCRFCHLLYESDLVKGVGGNISARSGEEVWLTPSGYSLRDIQPETIVRVDSEGHVQEGGVPTKDFGLHLGILRIRRDLNVVFHVHGVFVITACAMMDPGPDTLPPITPGFVFFAYPLAMLPFMVPGSKALTKAAVKNFSQGECRALLLQNHGFITAGKDFDEALNIAEEIDEAARIYVLSGGKAKEIPKEGIEEIKGLKIED